MKDSQEFKKKKIKKIHTVEQLVSSLLIAEVIMERRGELKEKLNEDFKNSIPKLEGENISQRAIDLYNKAALIIAYKPYYLYLLKYAIEDIYTYEFQKDPSVITSSAQDSAYLQSLFGQSFSALAKINLEEHTLNVFEFAIQEAVKSGRPAGMAAAIIGSILHDFGKSTQIRKKVKGAAQSRNYTAHAEVSALYIRELLLTKLYNKLEEVPIDIIDNIADMVKNHHPNSAKLKSDINISFIIKADHNARKMEFKKLKQEKEN